MPNLDKDKDFTWLPELFSYLLAFSSVCFDLIIQEMLHLQYSGSGDDIITVNGTLLKLVFLKGKGQIPFF